MVVSRKADWGGTVTVPRVSESAARDARSTAWMSCRAKARSFKTRCVPPLWWTGPSGVILAVGA